MKLQILSAVAWQSFAGVFVALWTDAELAYGFFDSGFIATMLVDGMYPALSPRYPGAGWFERLDTDLNGHKPSGVTHEYTAIEHFRGPDGAGAWPNYPLPPVAGAHQIGMGPVHGGITAPSHFRFDVTGEQVLNLRTRFGYAHKGTLALMRGKSPRNAARFAARISGDATVAHSLAFAHATEAALTITVPARAVHLRAVMAEIERMANHAADLGAIAAAAGLAFLEARFGQTREALCMAAHSAFGHRLMMDMVIPGGVAGDLKTGGASVIQRALDALEKELPSLTRIFETNAGLQNRLVGTGIIPNHVAELYGAGGFTGRASGRAGDARMGYAPYHEMSLNVPVETAGDAAARVKIRLVELVESTRLIRLLLGDLAAGMIAVAPPSGSFMGLGVAESFRGAVWHWVNIDNGQLADIFIADASTLQWPLVEHAAIGGNVADFPMIEKSINVSCSGMDM